MHNNSSLLSYCLQYAEWKRWKLLYIRERCDHTIYQGYCRTNNYPKRSHSLEIEAPPGVSCISHATFWHSYYWKCLLSIRKRGYTKSWDGSFIQAWYWSCHEDFLGKETNIRVSRLILLLVEIIILYWCYSMLVGLVGQLSILLTLWKLDIIIGWMIFVNSDENILKLSYG